MLDIRDRCKLLLTADGHYTQEKFDAKVAVSTIRTAPWRTRYPSKSQETFSGQQRISLEARDNKLIIIETKKV